MDAANPRKRNRRKGRFAKSPACRACGKPCPVDAYASHPMTDCAGDDGESWHDAAIVLCDGCYSRTDHMRNIGDFVRFRDIGWY